MHALSIMTALVGTTACVTDAAPTGRVAVALTAPGAGGATYRFAPGTRLVLMQGDYFSTAMGPR